MIQYVYDRLSGRVVYVNEVSKRTKEKYDLQCLLCEEDIILRAGDIKAKHFAHKSLSYGKKCFPETIHHQAAKLLLAVFINEGGQVTIDTCECNPSIDISLCEAKTEYPVANGTADIALLRDNNLVCLFEIKHTHSTEQRQEKWFEFTADDIMDALDTEEKKITLENVRICPHKLPEDMKACNPDESPPTPIKLEHREVLLFLESERYYTSENTSAAKMIPRVNPSSEMLYYCEDMSLYYDSFTERREMRKIQENKDFMDWADKLGFYGTFNDWKDPSKRITLLCLKDKKYSIRKGWVAFTNILHDAWIKTYTIFKKKHKCLKCRKRCVLFFFSKCIVEIVSLK